MKPNILIFLLTALAFCLAGLIAAALVVKSSAALSAMSEETTSTTNTPKTAPTHNQAKP